jgi:hypothetical protein
VFKYFKRKKAAKKVLIAADKMAQRLQSLPWCNNTEGTQVSLDSETWKHWNYHECDRLIE